MSLRDKFDLVIFDWAGTMVDFGSEAPVLALIEAYEAEGVAITAAAARQDMGKAKRDHVNGLMAIPDVAKAWQAKFGRASNADDVDRLLQPDACWLLPELQPSEQDEEGDERQDRKERRQEQRVADRVEYLLVHAQSPPEEWIALSYPGPP